MALEDTFIYGNIGFSGHIGISGYSGLDGTSGFSGYSGFIGISGYSGYSGINGVSENTIAFSNRARGRPLWIPSYEEVLLDNWTELYDIGNHIDGASFTPGTFGIYHFDVKVMTEEFDVGTDLFFILYLKDESLTYPRNTNTISQFVAAPSGGTVIAQAQVSCDVPGYPDSNFKTYIYNNTASSFSIYNVEEYVYWNGHRIPNTSSFTLPE